VSVRGAKQLLGALLFVVGEDVLDAQDGYRLVVAIGQRHFRADRKSFNNVAVAIANRGEAQRHRPHHTITQTTLFEHGVVVGLVHEAFVGGQHTRGDHLYGDHRLQIHADAGQGARTFNLVLDAILRDDLVDQRSTVRLLWV